jgi:hypothetical protein
MVTRVRGDRIQLIHQWRVVFDADLLKPVHNRLP